MSAICYFLEYEKHSILLLYYAELRDLNLFLADNFNGRFDDLIILIRYCINDYKLKLSHIDELIAHC